MTISSRHPARLLILAGASAVALSAPAGAGGPDGGTVVRGQAQIAQTAARTTIRQQSRRAVIDWRGFDVDRGHTVVFAQPGRDAATLNRVDTASPSTIRGAIRAPGTVVIQNGAGVLFTGSARVDVGGLVATGQTVDVGRFMREGKVTTKGGEAAGARIVNRGEITIGGAGLAALVGGDVENAGAIVARRGTVTLAGGKRTTIDLTGDGLVKLAVAGDGRAAQTGMIDVGDGRVVITAGAAAAALDAAINTSGITRANGPDGAITIRGRGKAAVRIGGRLEAAGGQVRVRGQDVAITRNATVAATGGSVAALARDTTRVAGRIAARGGFVETSATGAVGVGHHAEIAVGDGGRWLIDPRDIIIGNAGGTPGATPPGNTPLTISRVALQNALNAGTDVTINTAQAASAMAGDITVAGPLSWTGAGDLTLRADRDITINAAITTRTGDFTALATRNLRIDADLRATDTAAVRMEAAQGYLRVARHSSSIGQVLATDRGDLTLAAPRGKVEIGRLGGESGTIEVRAASGATSIRAGDEIHIWGADIDGGWTRIGAADSRSAVTLAAPAVTVRGGAGPTSLAEVVTGPGGALTLQGGSRIVVTGTTAEGRVAALGGAPLTLTAPVQYWDGPVQSGSGRADGGSVRVSGAVSAPVAPTFSLAPGADFSFTAPSTPVGPFSGYSSTRPLAVSTSGSGTVTIGGAVSATQVTLLSDAAVRLGPTGRLRGTATGDAVVVSAGRSFVNEAGADALQGDRWLLYLDRFDGLTGTEPAGHGFDLYGRRHATTPPEALGFGGNRIVYAERPTLTVTAGTLDKTYGTAVVPGYTVAGLRSGDTLATALDGGPTVASSGAGAAADVGSYPTRADATASAQGYALAFVDGTLTVDPAPLTVTAEDAARRYGAGDPDFAARFDGFVLGQDVGDLGGELDFASAAGRDSDVGRYAVTPGGLTSGNYRIRFEAGTLTIDPAPLVVTALDARRTYGAANPGFAARYDGFVLGQDAGVLDGRLELATEAGQDADAGRHAITAGGLSSGNYAIRYQSGTLTVDPAALTVTALDARRIYGAANPGFVARLDGFVLGEDASALDGELRLGSRAGRASGVGRYAITATGLTSGNYAITYRPGTLTVERAALTVTALDAARTYGAANPAFAVRYDGFVLGQDEGVLGGRLGFDTGAAAGSGVGRYALTPRGLASGNYAISYRSGTLAVDPAALTVTALDAARVAGAANPDFAARFDGFVLGEDAGVLGGRLGFATAAGADSPAGDYAVTPGGLSAANYAIRYAAGTLTVLPAPAPPVPDAIGPVVGAERFARGVPPLTPGDASFRTTVAEAPPALANPFGLTYSLGEVVELAPPGAAGAEGFVAAAGRGAATEGFTPSAGTVQAEAEGAAAGACGGSVNRGGATAGCGTRAAAESYWASR